MRTKLRALPPTAERLPLSLGALVWVVAAERRTADEKRADVPDQVVDERVRSEVGGQPLHVACRVRRCSRRATSSRSTGAWPWVSCSWVPHGTLTRQDRASGGGGVSSVHDVVVIGAGAMGSSAACALARAGREVVVVEQHQLGHELGGSHGGSRLFRLDYSSPNRLAQARRAERLRRGLEDESGECWLTNVGGIEDGRRRSGSRRRWPGAATRTCRWRCCRRRPRRNVGRSSPSRTTLSTSREPGGWIPTGPWPASGGWPLEQGRSSGPVRGQRR